MCVYIAVLGAFRRLVIMLTKALTITYLQCWYRQVCCYCSEQSILLYSLKYFSFMLTELYPRCNNEQSAFVYDEVCAGDSPLGSRLTN